MSDQKTAEIEAEIEEQREHLADTGQVVRTPRYGGPGRPEVEYRRT